MEKCCANMYIECKTVLCGILKYGYNGQNYVCIIYAQQIVTEVYRVHNVMYMYYYWSPILKRDVPLSYCVNSGSLSSLKTQLCFDFPLG